MTGGKEKLGCFILICGLLTVSTVLSKSKNSGKRKHKTKDKQPSVIPRGFSELWDLLGFQTSAWHLTSQHVPTGG
jgi:hypothetical protein